MYVIATFITATGQILFKGLLTKEIRSVMKSHLQSKHYFKHHKGHYCTYYSQNLKSYKAILESHRYPLHNECSNHLWKVWKELMSSNDSLRCWRKWQQMLSNTIATNMGKQATNIPLATHLEQHHLIIEFQGNNLETWCLNEFHCLYWQRILIVQFSLCYMVAMPLNCSTLWQKNSGKNTICSITTDS